MSASYSEIRDPRIYDEAMKLARGVYQRALLAGRHSLSGSTLRGNYSPRYRQSAANLLERCRNAGLAVREEIRQHGKRVLVIGFGAQCARDAQAAGYGPPDYWQYLDKTCHEQRDYFIRKGDPVTAELMLTQSLGESLAGNNGD